MTIKNIMFSGVMAVILGGVVAPAMAVEVTSKKYVDDKVVAAVASKAEQSVLNQEITDRAAADQALSGQIASEASARESADSSLQSQINAKAEKTYVGTIPTDASSQNVVDYVIERTSGLASEGVIEGKLNKNLGTENANKVVVTDASGAITAAAVIEQSQVNGLVDALGAKAAQADLENLATEVAGKANTSDLKDWVLTETYSAGQLAQDNKITALENKDTELAGQIAGKADAQTVTDLATEVAGKASQTALDNLSLVVDAKASQTDLSAEITNRTNADNSLQTEIDKKQAKLTAGDGIEIDAETNIITATAEAIEYTSGDAYVKVDNATDTIAVNADAAIADGATGLATSQAVMNYTLPVPADCAETTCVLGVQKNSKTPTWLKLELGESESF